MRGLDVLIEKEKDKEEIYRGNGKFF